METGIVKAGGELIVPAARKLITATEALGEAAVTHVADTIAIHGGKASRLLPRDPVTLPGQVMITYLPAGGGHKSAAQAIASALQSDHGIKAEIVDISTLSGPAKFGTDLFNDLVTTNKQFAGKSVWGWIYDVMDRKPPSEYTSLAGKAWSYATMPPQWALDQLRMGVQSYSSAPFYKTLHELNPSVVINAHQIGADLIGWKARFGGPESRIHNMSVVTDHFGHSVYAAPGVEATFVPSAEVGGQLARRGVHPETIFETGIPVNPVFAHRPADLAATRQALGLTPGAQTVLVQGNLISDLGVYRDLIAQLKSSFPNGTGRGPVEIAVVAGKNEAMKHALEGWLKTQDLGPHLQVKVFGLVDAPTMRDLMAVSRVSVTKPGGLTTSESLTQGLPMLLVDVMKGGQETRNTEFLSRRGAAVSTGSFDQVGEKLVGLLQRPAQLDAMQAAALKLGRPRAANDIARRAVESLRQPTTR